MTPTRSALATLRAHALDEKPGRRGRGMVTEGR